MKRILFLFTASLLLLGCSNDDDSQPIEQNAELKIKKFTETHFDTNGEPNGQMTEYFFNENGKKTKDHIVDAFNDYVWEYAYNDLGQVTKKSHNYLNYPIDFAEKYYYNSDNKPFVILRDRDNDGVDVDSISFTYQPQQINVQWFTPGQERTEFYYNNIGVLTTVKHHADLGIVNNEAISYDSALNVTRLNVTTDFFNSETNHNYEYDDKINPFYKEFHNLPFNTYYYGYLSMHSQFISPSNATKIIRTGTDSSENFVMETSYQYNSSNYPISSETKRDGVLISRATYEYY